MEIMRFTLDKSASLVANADGSFSIDYVPPPVLTGKILWSAHHETGDLSEWYLPDLSLLGIINVNIFPGGGSFPSGSASTVPVTSPAIGKFSVNMTIDTSAGVSGDRLFRWKETIDDIAQGSLGRYFSAWFYFPRAVQVGSWWQIMGWKSKHAAGNDPFFNVNVKNRPNGNNYLVVFGWQPNVRTFFEQTIADVPVGKWFKIEAFYRPDAGTNGHLTLWQDDVLLTDIAGVQTRYPDGDYQFSINNYGQSLTPSIAIVYADDVAISTDRISNSQ